MTAKTGAGPTEVLRPGDAVVLTVPAGARVGLTGLADPGESSVICETAAAGGKLTLVARSPGYVRVAVVASAATSPALVFVKVSS